MCLKTEECWAPGHTGAHKSTLYPSILLPFSWATCLVRGSPLNWITGEKQHRNESVATDLLPQAWYFGGVSGGQVVEGLGLLLIIIQVAPSNEGMGSRQCHPSSFPSGVPWCEALHMGRDGCLSLMYVLAAAFQECLLNGPLLSACPHPNMHLHSLDFTANTNYLGCKRTPAGKRLVIIFSKKRRGKARAIVNSFLSSLPSPGYLFSLLSQNEPTRSTHLSASSWAPHDFLLAPKIYIFLLILHILQHWIWERSQQVPVHHLHSIWQPKCVSLKILRYMTFPFKNGFWRGSFLKTVEAIKRELGCSHTRVGRYVSQASPEWQPVV